MERAEEAGNLSATFARLDREGAWIPGTPNDRYWSDRERAVMLAEARFVSSMNSASYGAFEEGGAKSRCCLSDKEAQTQCGLYKGKCCFYSLRHVCAANGTAAVTQRYTGLTKTWADISALLEGRRVLVIGDSVSHQTFEAAVCDIYRHGYTQTSAHNCENEPNDENKAICCYKFSAAGRAKAFSLCFAWMAEYNKLSFEKMLAVSNAQVLIFNLGLWYGDAEEPGTCADDLQADLKSSFNISAKWADACMQI